MNYLSKGMLKWLAGVGKLVGIESKRNEMGEVSYFGCNWLNRMDRKFLKEDNKKVVLRFD